MDKVVNFQKYRTKTIEQKGFGPWQKRFGESYDVNTKLSDLSEKTLYLLALPGEENTFAYYELIMGILGLGGAPKFYYLENQDQMKVMDIHLFIADQVRFEMMRRLGWIERFAGEAHSLLEMVQSFEAVKNQCRGNPPQLSKSHPNYPNFRELVSGDKEAFVRRMLPNALETYKKKIGM